MLALRIIQLVSALVLIVVVLFQSGKKSGLSGAIAGGSDTFMARNKSSNLDARLAKMTKWFAAVFAILTLALSLM